MAQPSPTSKAVSYTHLGETEELLLKTELTEYASYDDSGVTGHKSCYVLEEGDYIFYAGTDVRSAAEAGKATLTELRVVRMVTEAMAPVQEFKRLKPFFFEEKDHAIANWEDVPCLLYTSKPLFCHLIFFHELFYRNIPDVFLCHIQILLLK